MPRARITLLLKTTCSYVESQRAAWGGVGFLELEFLLLNLEREELVRGGGADSFASFCTPSCLVYCVLDFDLFPAPPPPLDCESPSDVPLFLKYHPAARSLAQSRCSVIPLKSCVRRILLGPTPRHF